ncbi:hypothetical protein MTR67_039972, partial [Solanum verrucosum]
DRGNKTLFWKENWTGHGSLKNIFPGLFSICQNPNSKIQEVWSPQGWNLLFRRFLNDWEIEWVSDMLSLIGDFPGTNLETDKLLWRHHTNGQFSVNRMYKMDLATIARKKLGPCSVIWKSVSPTKVKCFTWLVTRGACLTHDKLQKRGRIIASRCYLCKEALETNNHLFLHCKVTTQVWALFTNLAGLNWIMP